MLSTGQAVIGTTAATVFREPPGPGMVTVTSDTASTATCYLGAGTAVTTGNGMPLVPGGAVSWATYPGSTGAPISAVTSAASAATIGWVLSTGG